MAKKRTTQEMARVRRKMLQVPMGPQLEANVEALRLRWECTISEAVRRAVREAVNT